MWENQSCISSSSLSSPSTSSSLSVAHSSPFSALAAAFYGYLAFHLSISSYISRVPASRSGSTIFSLRIRFLTLTQHSSAVAYFFMRKKANAKRYHASTCSLSSSMTLSRIYLDSRYMPSSLQKRAVCMRKSIVGYSSLPELDLVPRLF